MLIPIVNEQDEIIGHKERKDRLPNEIVRAAAVWVTNEKGEILLSQRSFEREWYPGLWSSAAGGMIEEGETYESGALREAEEEIGLRGVSIVPEDKIPPGKGFNAFLHYFSATVDSTYTFVLQKEEVADIKWFTKDELLTLIKEQPEKYLLYFDYVINHFLKNEN